ncbi:MAG: hypothetical protein SGPRY_012881, partial [Prymnesium sp.]
MEVELAATKAHTSHLQLECSTLREKLSLELASHTHTSTDLLEASGKTEGLSRELAAQKALALEAQGVAERAREQLLNANSRAAAERAMLASELRVYEWKAVASARLAHATGGLAGVYQAVIRGELEEMEESARSAMAAERKRAARELREMLNRGAVER